LNDGIGILPTDTLYGISGRALSVDVVERIKKIKKRLEKPFIVLISSIDDLEKFGIKSDEYALEIFQKYWPGKVTIVLDCNSKEFEYLHLGKETLAFRMPDKKDLLELIKKTGPLISTSANPEGEKPASTIGEAKAYFGNLSPTTFFKKEENYKYIFDNNQESLNSKRYSSKVVGDKLDFYVDEGKLESLPSTLIKIENRKIVVLREGAVKI